MFVVVFFVASVTCGNSFSLRVSSSKKKCGKFACQLFGCSEMAQFSLILRVLTFLYLFWIAQVSFSPMIHYWQFVLFQLCNFQLFCRIEKKNFLLEKKNEKRIYWNRRWTIATDAISNRIKRKSKQRLAKISFFFARNEQNENTEKSSLIFIVLSFFSLRFIEKEKIKWKKWDFFALNLHSNSMTTRIKIELCRMFTSIISLFVYFRI